MIAAPHRPYVETHPTWIVWAIVGGCAVAIELAGALRRRAEATRKDQGSLILLRLVTAPGFLLLIFSPRLVPALEIRPPLVSVIVGLVLFASGEALRVWSKVSLGRYFTYTVQTSTDQPVIETGPYRFVRHPSYTGLALMAVGVGAIYGNWLGLAAVTIAMLAGLGYRIRIEEQALLADLGERYRAFAEHRKRLVPYVW